MYPHIAITLGDPQCIGAEVAFQSVRDLKTELKHLSITFLGSEETRDQVPSEHEFIAVGAWDGTPKGAGQVAALAIEQAVTGVRDGLFHTIVTAPVHKPSLRSAGWDVPGQTEMLQKLTGSNPVGMLMAAEMTDRGSPLRVLLATTHHPLREAISLLSEELLLEQIVLLSKALQSDWGLVAPQIAICGLNPHASDDGLFGDEEAMILSPAIERAREMGTNVTGPFPADTVFYRALTGNFDAIVAPYHDVGMAAFKTAAFGRGVNVTLGLPFVRTSPDHGTAFDIAGTSSANATSMVEAVRLAIHLTQNRFSKISLHD